MSVRNNNRGANSTDFSYGNVTGIYRFDANPVQSNFVVTQGSGGGRGNSTKIYSSVGTSTKMNGNGKGYMNANGYVQSSMNMNNLRNSLPSVVQRNNMTITRLNGVGGGGCRTTIGINPRRLSRNGGIGGAKLHPRDYHMLNLLSGLPTRFNISGKRRSDTR
jgi:hypothetical protein